MANVTTQTYDPGEFILAVAEDGIIPLNLAAACVDAGNTGLTHILRPGLAIGGPLAAGTYTNYDNDASDGSENFVGYLTEPVDMKDGGATASIHSAPVLVRGQVKEAKLIHKDADALAAAIAAAGYAGHARIWYLPFDGS